MKNFKYLLFILPFLFINTAYALDYTFTNRFAGINVEQSTGNFINAGGDVTGKSKFSLPRENAFDYIVLTYCSSSDRVQPGFAPNSYITDSIYHIDTGQYCHTEYGSVTGTVKQNFFNIKNWMYSDSENTAYFEVSYTYFHNSDTTYSQAFRFLGLSAQSSQDVSIAILAYLKSQQNNQDYTSILNEIKNNQNDYKRELQDVNSSIKKTQETIENTDTQGAQDSAGGFFNDFTTDTHGLTAIITAPLSLITSITSKSCSPLVLPLPFVDKDLTLPCMGAIYSQYFGSFLSIYQVITFGIIAYWVCVRIFNLVKDFKNPDHDEIEVLDL